MQRQSRRRLPASVRKRRWLRERVDAVQRQATELKTAVDQARQESGEQVKARTRQVKADIAAQQETGRAGRNCGACCSRSGCATRVAVGRDHAGAGDPHGAAERLTQWAWWGRSRRRTPVWVIRSPVAARRAPRGRPGGWSARRPAAAGSPGTWPPPGRAARRTWRSRRAGHRRCTGSSRTGSSGAATRLPWPRPPSRQVDRLAGGVGDRRLAGGSAGQGQDPAEPWQAQRARPFRRVGQGPDQVVAAADHGRVLQVVPRVAVEGGGAGLDGAAPGDLQRPDGLDRADAGLGVARSGPGQGSAGGGDGVQRVGLALAAPLPAVGPVDFHDLDLVRVR
jgi:hypothetical protein